MSALLAHALDNGGPELLRRRGVQVSQELDPPLAAGRSQSTLPPPPVESEGCYFFFFGVGVGVGVGAGAPADAG